ncbi:hypothetical protein NECID01_0369 [Nematocida sp. AWRm77]|nr:hypothetical protein NECID01_0369 [Nematocida sp. AWRm77]
MLLKAGLKLCTDKNCLNSEEKTVSLKSIIQREGKAYCHQCVENGLDYVYANGVLCDTKGSVLDPGKKEKIKPMEESFYLQKIRRRGLLRKAPAVFGLFSKREYAPNEVVGVLSGVVVSMQKTSAPAVKKTEDACRCFLMREESLVIDSRDVGNLSRFIRRSCRPNVAIHLENTDEWKKCPPLKKISRKFRFTQAKLYALSRIYTNTELFIDTAHSAGREEAWVSADMSEVAVGPKELHRQCAGPMQWVCMCETFPLLTTNRRITESSNISPFFSRMHKYVNRETSLSTEDMSFLLEKKCVFIK